MNWQVIKTVMQAKRVLARMKKLEKEMQELRRGLYSHFEVSASKPKKAMHRAATEFLELKSIQDKIEMSSVELIRKERKHARGY